MSKSLLRSQYKKRRAQLGESQLESASLKIANHSLRLPIWNFEYYHLFLPIAKQREVQTEFLLHILQGKDKGVVLSKSDFNDFSMTHYLLQDSTTIKTNSFGIPEPTAGLQVNASQLEVVFVPLLAFDLSGNRLGYGKGFYDRFLAYCNPKVVKVGLSFFSAEQQIESGPKDIPLNFCVTPDKIYEF